MTQKQRRILITLLKVALFIYFPSIVIYFLAYAVGQESGGLLDLNISVLMAKTINIIGFFIGWIGTVIQAKTFQRYYRDKGAGQIASVSLFFALIVVSLMLYI